MSEGMKTWWRRILDMYADGFRNMTVGRKLWAIVILKLAIMFFIFRLFFFPDILKENYADDDARARAVATELTGR